MILKISNKKLEVSIESCGACLRSLYDRQKSKELLYQVNPDIWTSQDITIFPVIDWPVYKIDGVDYRCNTKHGILREKDSTPCSVEKERAVLKFESDEGTIQQFPFRFEFYVCFELHDSVLTVSYKVVNLESTPMPCYLGGHPGLYAKNGKAEIVFEEEEQPRIWNLDDGEVVSSSLCKKFKTLKIDKESLQRYKTYIFSNLKSSFLIMKTEDVNYKFTFNSPVLGLWSKPHAGEYICIEPWWGMAMQKNDEREFCDKEFVNIISTIGDFSYSIEIM